MFCTDIPDPAFLIFSEFTPQILYYSHIPSAIIALLFGIFVFYKTRNLIGSTLLFVSIAFTAWSFFDLILWTNSDGRLIMFFWSIINLVEVIISLTMLYFTYLFLHEKEAPLSLKLAFGILVLPFIVFLPTAKNISGFDIALCEALQGPLINYFYFIEITIFLSTLVLIVHAWVKSQKEKRVQIIYYGLGVILFLLSFSGANILASLTGRWEIVQYGLFGMPIFWGFLILIIVRFKSLDIKLAGPVALVFGLGTLVFSLLFIHDIETVRWVVLTTLAFVIIFGYALIHSVRREIRQREQIEELAQNLRKANERLRELDKQKTEFVSIASHQLRSPLTAINGYASLLLEGSFGELPQQAKSPIEKIFHSGRQMAVSIDDFLNVTRIEQGRMKYVKTTFDLREAAGRTVDELRLLAKDKNLALTYQESPDELLVTADKGKITQVITNLIDNSIKYTKTGTIAVSIEKDSHSNMARFAIVDTGIGMSKDAQTSLFQKFGRADNANSADVHGTGLGLYIAKQMILAHSGDIWGVSQGEGKGSEFGFSLPLAKEGAVKND